MSGIKLFFIYFLFYYSFYVTCLCTQDGYPFEQYLSSKTPYRMVSNNSFAKMNYDGCHPIKCWMIVRHGTRYINKMYIALMQTRLTDIRGFILNSTKVPNEYTKNRDLDLFRNWEVSVVPENDRKLTPEGEEEMLLLAERMQTRFPELFDNSYSNTTYTFRYTRSQRTQKSAYYFASGLFGTGTAKDVWFPYASRRDPILRFYKLCEKWKTHIEDGATAQRERESFRRGPEMNKTVHEVNERLGLNGKLNYNDVSLMHRICAYETAWNKNRKSPWCSVFSLEDFKVFEYQDDLKYYWQDGYGFELAYKQACLIFSNMTTFMQAEHGSPKVVVYFTHSGTLLKLMAHIGLNKDREHLMANNFAFMADRKFRTSKIDSFATNIAFVLFKCGSTSKLLTMYQEHIIRLPACPDTDLCDLNRILEFYSDSIENCDFETFCKVS